MFNQISRLIDSFEDVVKSTGNEGKLFVSNIAELLDFAQGGDSPIYYYLNKKIQP